jgi:hypothetical protein
LHPTEFFGENPSIVLWIFLNIMKRLSLQTKPERSNLMAEIINHIYQFKRGTAQRWIEVNPILRQGEPGFEYDTGKLKIGDGFTPWLALPYINDVNVSG